MFARCGAERTLALRIENNSATRWDAWEDSGIALACRWKRWGRRHRYPGPLAGLVRLPAALEPGESTTLELPVRAPARPGLWLLDVDLVEEGVTWFQARTGDSRSRLVFVNGSPRLWWQTLFERARVLLGGRGADAA